MNKTFRIQFGFSCSDNRQSKIENRKWLECLAILLLLTGWVRMVEAQQPKKVSRLGYLSNTDAATDSARAEGIRLALRERGYIEGQNIAIEYRYAEGRRDRESGLAAELVRLKVDILVVASGDVTIQLNETAVLGNSSNLFTSHTLNRTGPPT